MGERKEGREEAGMEVKVGRKVRTLLPAVLIKGHMK